MKLIHDRLDYSTPWYLPDVYLFTGNKIVKKNGALVMGRGAARQVRDSYPGIDQQLGHLITRRNNDNLLWTVISPAQHLGWFKVKEHWADEANVNLIQESTDRLVEIATMKGSKYTFHMNYPGIGNGRLNVSQVEEIIAKLPDNVFIYK